MGATFWCNIIIYIIAILLIVTGFVFIFRGPQAGQSELQVISDQVKGFGFLIVGQMVLVAGLGLCAGEAMWFRRGLGAASI